MPLTSSRRTLCSWSVWRHEVPYSQRRQLARTNLGHVAERNRRGQHRFPAPQNDQSCSHHCPRQGPSTHWRRQSRPPFQSFHCPWHVEISMTAVTGENSLDGSHQPIPDFGPEAWVNKRSRYSRHVNSISTPFFQSRCCPISEAHSSKSVTALQ